MHVDVLVHDETTLYPSGLTSALEVLGHTVHALTVAEPTVDAAAALGHSLVDRWAATGRPDVVLAADWTGGLAAQVATRETSVPVVQRLFAPGRSGDPDRRRLEAAIGRSATLVLASCSSDVDRLVTLGVRRRAVRVVPHGVDTVRFVDDGPAAAPALRRLVARPDAVAESTTRLVAVLPLLAQCELVLLTTRATHDVVVRALAGAADVPSVAARVRVVDLTKEGAGPGLPSLLRSAELALVTGDDQPELDLALQAMACGRPVVAVSVGALGDVVAEGVTGALVGAPTPEGLADAVRRLLADDLQRQAESLAAGDRARASFGWDTVGPALGRVLDEVAPDVKSGPLHADASP